MLRSPEDIERLAREGRTGVVWWEQFKRGLLLALLLGMLFFVGAGLGRFVI